MLLIYVLLNFAHVRIRVPEIELYFSEKLVKNRIHSAYTLVIC